MCALSYDACLNHVAVDNSYWFGPKGQAVDMVCDWACTACSYIWHLAEDWLGQKVRNCLFVVGWADKGMHCGHSVYCCHPLGGMLMYSDNISASKYMDLSVILRK